MAFRSFDRHGHGAPDRLLNSASPVARFPGSLAAIDGDSGELGVRRRGARCVLFPVVIDLYSAIYDPTDASDLPQTDAWQVRQAFVGGDAETRIAAIRRLLAIGQGWLFKGRRPRAGRSRGDLGRAGRQARRDAPELISAMLAGV